MSAPKPPAGHRSGEFTAQAVVEEIQWLESLSEWRFREEVANYLKRPFGVTRAALRSNELATRTYEALQVLFQETAAKIEHETSGERIRQLATFQGRVTAERKMVLPNATQAVLLTTRKGPVYEALLQLKDMYEDDFQRILAQVKKDRKKKPRPSGPRGRR